MRNYKDLNDYEIMYMVAENNEIANNILYEKYKPIVLAYASKYLEKAKKYGIELEDLIQEGYIGIFNAIKCYRHDMNVMFYTFVVISIKNRILNCIKKETTLKRKTLNESISLQDSIPNTEDSILLDIIEDTNSPLPELENEYHDLSLKIKQFLYSLEFTESLVFELKLNGFNQKEISTLLDISVACVSKYWVRARRKFFSIII